MSEIQDGDIVRFDPNYHDPHSVEDWRSKWGDKFLVVHANIDKRRHRCMPLEEYKPSTRFPPPWDFHSLVKDEFLTAVYKQRNQKCTNQNPSDGSTNPK